MADDKPLTDDELRDKISTSRVVYAESQRVDELASEVSIIIKALKQFGIGAAFVSDETCFSDFCITPDEYPELSKAIGVELDPAYEDDWWLVRVAAKMKRQRMS